MKSGILDPKQWWLVFYHSCALWIKKGFVWIESEAYFLLVKPTFRTSAYGFPERAGKEKAMQKIYLGAWKRYLKLMWLVGSPQTLGNRFQEKYDIVRWLRIWTKFYLLQSKEFEFFCDIWRSIWQKQRDGAWKFQVVLVFYVL